MPRHSIMCPSCGATMTNVVQIGNTLKAACDACGWTGSKTRTTPHTERNTR